eukprot:5294608-Pleurochrysis_carterae.AAC.1
MKRMKEGRPAVQRSHSQGSYLYWVVGQHAENGATQPGLAYCAKGLTPKALQFGCRRPFRLSGDMTGCCNLERQKHCFRPKGFSCQCGGELTFWKHCTCTPEIFQAA